MYKLILLNPQITANKLCHQFFYYIGTAKVQVTIQFHLSLAIDTLTHTTGNSVIVTFT